MTEDQFSVDAVREHYDRLSVWMSDSGFTRIEAEDITRRVEGTWARCAALVSRAEVKAALRLGDERTRRFVEAFTAIRQAYAEGAMACGMFAARKI